MTEALREIDRKILSAGEWSEYVKFRTFRLLNPGGLADDWYEFSDKMLVDALSSVLESLPVSTVLLLCRRHFTELPFFLVYFDSSAKAAMEPKTYLPFLCQHVHCIPIQWILKHVRAIKDVRYAFQLVAHAFASGVSANGHQNERIAGQKNVWERLQQLTGKQSRVSRHDAWLEITGIRASMRELIDFKLPIKLDDYLKLKKEEVIRRLLDTCTTAIRLTKLLKEQVRPLSQVCDIELGMVVGTTVARKEWTTRQKLEIVREFVEDKEDIRRALELMTFASDEELDEICAFGEMNGTSVYVNPCNFVQLPMNARSSPAKALARTSSVGFIQVQDVVPLNLGTRQRSPSAATFSLDPIPRAAVSFDELANGEPSDPQAYAEKLAPFKTLSKITPIFELACHYEIVVRFGDLRNPAPILTKIVKQAGLEDFDKICKLLDFSPDDVVSSMLQEFDELKDAADMILVHMSRLVRRSNVVLFVEFLGKTVDLLLVRSPVATICDLWSSCLLEVVDVIDGSELMSVVQRIRVLGALQTLEAPEEVKREIIGMVKENCSVQSVAEKLRETGYSKMADEIAPTELSSVSVEDFQSALTSKDPIDVVTALPEILVTEKQRAIELLIGAIEVIDGTNYSRLLCIFKLLEGMKLKYVKEIAALQVLHHIDSVLIDFHTLMSNPKEALVAAITRKNIWEILPLAPLFSVSTDELILHVMINVMDSRYFDDYQVFIPRLKKRDSLASIVDAFQTRLLPSELPYFYGSVGISDRRNRELTINDLKSRGLADIATDKYLKDPASLICTVYSRMALHESMGKRLHDMTKRIAKRYGLSIDKIREHVVSVWLNECESKDIHDNTSVYVETMEEAVMKDENTNIQKALFVLRSWKQRTATKWLIQFAYQTNAVSYRAKAKAFACLFAIADEEMISDVFSGSFEDLTDHHKRVYFWSRLEVVGAGLNIASFEKESLVSTIAGVLARPQEYGAGVLAVLLEVCIDYNIDDKAILFDIISKLKETRKRFVMTRCPSLFGAFHSLARDCSFQTAFIEAISAPIDELIAKTENTRVVKAHHLSVIRELLDALASEPFVVDTWMISGEQLRWDQMVGRLCSSGFPSLAAEIGAFVVEPELRDAVLNTLLHAGHFDEVLKFGFDRDAVFGFILKESLASATETMIDEHFVMLVAWLKDREEEDAIETVRETLVKQGRTMEVKRMAERLEAQERSRQELSVSDRL